MTTFTINISLEADDAVAVEQYIRDSIDNADADWEVESATLESNGVTTDLLEEVDDEADEDDDTDAEATQQEAVEEEDTEKEASPTSEPTGGEF